MALNEDQQENVTVTRSRPTAIIDFLEEKEPRAYSLQEISEGIVGADETVRANGVRQVSKEEGFEENRIGLTTNLRTEMTLEILAGRGEVERLRNKDSDDQIYYRIASD